MLQLGQIDKEARCARPGFLASLGMPGALARGAVLSPGRAGGGKAWRKLGLRSSRTGRRGEGGDSPPLDPPTLPSLRAGFRAGARAVPSEDHSRPPPARARLRGEATAKAGRTGGEEGTGPAPGDRRPSNQTLDRTPAAAPPNSRTRPRPVL